MFKPMLVVTSVALAAFSLPSVAQQRVPGLPEPSAQQPVQRDGNTGGQTLNLTQEEQHTVLQNVENNTAGSSTMGLGALSEGAAVPSTIKTKKFNDTVTTKVPKLKAYSYFTADNKLAIVEPNGTKIAAVLDQDAPAAK